MSCEQQPHLKAAFDADLEILGLAGDDGLVDLEGMIFANNREVGVFAAL